MSSKENKYLDILQIFRGFAALMVVVHHTLGALVYYNNLDYYFVKFIGDLGKYGVDFFFVLSGFIIAFTSYYKYNKPLAYRKYIINRALRIYVPYIPVGYLMLFLYANYPELSNASRLDFSYLTSLTLLPDGFPAYGVAWTLIFELMFYFLFSLTFISKKIWNWFLIIWLILIVKSNFITDVVSNEKTFYNVFLSLYNLEFMLGYLLSILIIRKVKWNYLFVVTIFIVFTLFSLVLKYYNIILFKFSDHIFVGINSFLLIYISVTYFNPKLNERNVFMMIGNATYSIYLIHDPLKTLIIRLFPNTNSLILNFLILTVVLVICSIVGYIYYLIFEKYIMNKFKKTLGV